MAQYLRFQSWRPHIPRLVTRRDFLFRPGAGFGTLALSALLSDEAGAQLSTLNSQPPTPPHFAPKAKSVIWLFMEGGPSHIDLFDPKPELLRLAGKPLPASFERPSRRWGPPKMARCRRSARSNNTAGAGCGSQTGTCTSHSIRTTWPCCAPAGPTDPGTAPGR